MLARLTNFTFRESPADSTGLYGSIACVSVPFPISTASIWIASSFEPMMSILQNLPPI
jgi:hypothetical protein